MNEEAIQYSYELFKNDGYNGTIDDYKALINSDNEALNYSYNLFSKDGFEGSEDDFKNLIGVDKILETPKGVAAEESTELASPSASTDSSLVSQPIDERYDIRSQQKVVEPEFKADFQTPVEKDVEEDGKIPTLGYSIEKIERATKNIQKEYLEKGVKNYSISNDDITKEIERIDYYENLPKEEKVKLEGDWSVLAEGGKKFKATSLSALGYIAATPRYLKKILYSIVAPSLLSDEQINDFNNLPQDVRNKIFDNIQPPSGMSIAMNKVLNEDVRDELIKSAEVAESKIKQFETSITEDLYNLDFKQAGRRLVSEGIGAIPSIMQSMIPVIGLPSIVASSAARKQEELEGEGYNLDWKTSLNSSLTGAAEGVFEMVTRRIGNKMFRNLRNLNEFEVKSFTKEIAENLIVDPQLEGASEAATTLSEKLFDAVILDKSQDFSSILLEASDSYLIGAVTGYGMGSTSQLAQTTSKLYEGVKVNEILEDNKINKISDAFPLKVDNVNKAQLQIVSYNESINKLDKDLKKSVRAKEITEEEASKILQNAQKIRGFLDKTKGIKMSSDNRVSATNLIIEKDKLLAEVKNMDDVLAQPKKQRIEAINTELETLIQQENAIQKQTTGEVPVQPKTESSQEDERGQQKPKLEETTEEGGEKEVNKAKDTQGFFSDVVKGESDKYLPAKPYEYEKTFDKKQEKFKGIYDNRKGNFDEHIATSIPTFRDTQVQKGAAVIEVLKNEDSPLVYDIGGSEGGWVKAITEVSKNKIRTINLDPNSDMQSMHERTPVEGSMFIKEAFYEGFDDIKAHKPTEKADVVHESMVFQFIQPKRDTYIKEVINNYLKDDGIFITEEKFKLDNQDAEKENEKIKNTRHKSKYYTDAQQALKGEEVLVGMDKNQHNYNEYLNLLKNYFKYVDTYWKSGNFRGIVATNSKEKIDSFLKEIGDTSNQYTFEEEQDITTNGNYLNIGLNKAKTNEVISKESVKNSLPKDVEVLKDVIKEVKSDLGTESTLLLELSRPLTENEINNLLKETNQLAIPQYSNNKGIMYGSKEWGEFNSEYFYLPNGKKLKDILNESNKKKGDRTTAEKGKGETKGKTKTDKGDTTDAQGVKKSDGQKKLEDKFDGDPIAKEELVEAVSKATTTLSKIAPDVTIIVAKDEAEYQELVGEQGVATSGTYRGGNTNAIYINPNKANKRTVAHEVFHAILWNKLKEGGTVLENTQKLFNSLSNLSPEIKKKIEAFSDQYEEGVQNEEALAEIVGYIAENYDSFSLKDRSKIRQFFDWLAKQFGLKKFTEQEVIELLNVIGRKVAEGVELTEDDIRLIEEMATPTSVIGGVEQIERKSIATAKLMGIKTLLPKIKGLVQFTPQSIEKILDKSGGAAVFINSDGTKVGYVRVNGKVLEIQGGLGYSQIEKNVNDNIGFAASEDAKISYLQTIVKQIIEERDSKYTQHKGKPIAVFVATQNAETMFGEWYAGEYIMEGIDLAKNKRKLKGTSNTLKEDLINITNSIPISKGNKDYKQIIKAKAKFLDLLNKGKLSSHEGRMEIARLLSSKEFPFGFRSKIIGAIIPSTLTDKDKLSDLQKGLLSVGHNKENFFNNFMDERLLPLFLSKVKNQSVRNSIVGGITMSGFMYDPYESYESKLKGSKNGIEHSQFNSSFTSTENFILDTAYNVNELFPEIGYPSEGGYEAYNKENKTNLTKENTTIIENNKISKWLLDNNYTSIKYRTTPVQNIGMSMYTGTVVEDIAVGRKQIPQRPKIEDVIKYARRNNIEDVDIKQYLLSKGYSVEEINEGLKNTPKASMSRAMQIVEDIVDKTKRRGIQDPKKIYDNVVAYLEGSVAFNELTDLEKESTIKELNKRFGIKVKRAPSVNKLLGIIQPKKVTISEVTALKDQIRLEAKAAREAKWDLNRKRVELSKVLTDLKKNGKISTYQLKVILNRMSKVNLDNEEAVGNFINFIEKVYTDAEFTFNMLTSDKKRKIASKNIKTKIGTAKGSFEVFKTLFNLDPKKIPSEVFEDYVELLDIFGVRKAVLDFKGEIINSVEKAESIINSIIENTVEEDTKSDEEILEEQLAKKEQEENDKLEAIDTIISMQKPTTNNLKNRLDKELADKLLILVEDIEALSGLTLQQLRNVPKVLQNIADGIYSNYAENIRVELEASQSFNETLPIVKKATQMFFAKLSTVFEKFITMSNKSSVLIDVKSNPLYDIDAVLGNFKNRNLYNKTFGRVARIFSRYETDKEILTEKLLRADNRLSSSLNGNHNAKVRSKYRISAYMIQKEFESNPNSNKVFSAVEAIKANIKYLDSYISNFNNAERDKRYFEELLSEIENMSSEDIYEGFSEAEKNLIETIEEVNQELSDKLLHASSVQRKGRPDILVNYTHHQVLGGSQSNEIQSVAEKYNVFSNPSTKAGTQIERTSGVKPLNFDITEATMRGARETLIDFHMTSEIRTAFKIFNRIERSILSDPQATKTQKQVATTLKKAFDESMRSAFEVEFTSHDSIGKLLNEAKRLGYRALLAGVPRAMSEFLSNSLFVATTAPIEFFKGASDYTSIAMSYEGRDIMYNLGSNTISKIYTSKISGKGVDFGLFPDTVRIKRDSALSDLGNVYDFIAKAIPLKKAIDSISDGIISTPDKVISRPLWFGTFATEFKNLTGKDIDFNKIRENDYQYIKDNKIALDKSTNKADLYVTRAATSKNPFSGILKNRKFNSDASATKFFKEVNGLFTNFTIYEYVTARTAVNALVGRGEMTKAQGAMLLTGAVARMSSYMVFLKMFQALIYGGVAAMSGIDIGDDEEDYLELTQKQIVGSILSLMFGRNFGNFTKIPISLGVEHINEKHLESLRGGKDYDPYRDALLFSMVGMKDFEDPNLYKTLVTKFSGAYAPHLKTAGRVQYLLSIMNSEKSSESAKQKAAQELYLRAPVEVLGTAGMIPLYKDVRAIMLKSMFNKKEEEKVTKTIK